MALNQYYDTMTAMRLSHETISTIATAVSAAVAVINLVLVAFLARYTITTTKLLQEQARDTRTQAEAAQKSLRVLLYEQTVAYMNAWDGLNRIMHNAVEVKKCIHLGEPIPRDVEGFKPSNWSEIVTALVFNHASLSDSLLTLGNQLQGADYALQACRRGRVNEELIPAFESLENAITAMIPNLSEIVSITNSLSPLVPSTPTGL
jgi:hypothetical protein